MFTLFWLFTAFNQIPLSSSTVSSCPDLQSKSQHREHCPRVDIDKFISKKKGSGLELNNPSNWQGYILMVRGVQSCRGISQLVVKTKRCWSLSYSVEEKQMAANDERKGEKIQKKKREPPQFEFSAGNGRYEKMRQQLLFVVCFIGLTVKEKLGGEREGTESGRVRGRMGGPWLREAKGGGERGEGWWMFCSALLLQPGPGAAGKVTNRTRRTKISHFKQLNNKWATTQNYRQIWNQSIKGSKVK